MSRIIVDSLRGNSASSDAISLANDGTCIAKITNNLSNRNLIINGSHIVWQRTTSISGGTLGNFVYATDRFWLYSPSSSSGTVQQSTDVPSGFIYSTHNNLDAECLIGTNVELFKVGSDAPFVNGESLTLSFYIKSTSARSNVAIDISTRDNAGGTGSVTRATSPTFNTTTNWTRVEKTFTLTGTVGSSNACLQFQFTLAVGDKVTGFQLEKNSFATDFEFRSYAQELALAQRYFQKNATAQMYMAVIRTADSQHRLNLNLPVTMRATPTGTVTSANQDGGPSLTIESGSSEHTIKIRQGPAVNTSSAPSVSEYTLDAEF
tara:strand:+ start:26 stop:985 length:960 start_codon:yes stop_codon:yes gene_type:complete